MKSNAIQEKSFKFAIRAVNFYKYLTLEKKEYVLSKQVLRSGTAIGALVREAQQGESRADFIHKMAIALKEAKETEYWILLLNETDYMDKIAFNSMFKDIEELIKLLTSIINTAKKNR
ncbi:hypothetical protein AA637_04975 [Cyanobacterium sp. HL-69]|uniref:four helix bundle protein n=1 Tax=Cyanobacterium sp. HL-69 TaxID=2054282 RepID=UPI000CA2FD69|nr:hypothetical protein AA637_04975 [Cyanobacterium sp. HL-69]